MRKRIFTVLMALFSFVAVQAQLYVTDGGSGAMDGSSWENASKDIQAMIDKAYQEGGGEVWVAKGVYTPTVKIAEEAVFINIDEITGVQDTIYAATTNRHKAFRLRSGVSLYGGFPATGGDWGSRDVELYETVLSGALSTNEHAYHVVVAMADDMNGAEFDGFTITGGRAYYTVDDPDAENVAVVHPTSIFLTDSNGELYYVTAEDEGGMPYLYNPLIGSKDGAGIRVACCSNYTFNNLKITGNIAAGNAGIYLSTLDNVIFSNSTVENNSAIKRNHGGFTFMGHSLDDNDILSSRLELTNLTFRNNSAIGYGGGGYISRVNLTLKNVSVENNNTLGAHGGLRITRCLVNAVDLYIKNNKGEQAGGAYFNNLVAGSSFSNLQILDNSTISGATGGAEFNQCEKLSINGLIVRGNRAALNRGGLYFVGLASTTVNDFIIENNHSKSGAGGGILYAASDVVFSNGQIVNNYASAHGGAVNITGESSFRGVNLLIAENTSDEGIAAIYMSTLASLELTNSTIVKNITASTSTAGLTFSSRDATLTNCILWGNENNNNNPISNITGALNGSNNLYQKSDGKSNLDGTDGTLTAVDIFINYAAGDYRLSSTSQAIDAGANDASSEDLDLDGSSRLVGTNVDLGAYEVQDEPEYKFTGGILNNGVHTYTYTGSPIDLKLVNTDKPVKYSWDGGLTYHDEVGIVDAGEYIVEVKVDEEPSSVTATVLVEKLNLYLSLDPIDMLVRSLTDVGEKELTVNNDWSEYGGAPNISYTSSNEDYVRIVSGNTARGVTTGGAMITTSTDASNVDALKNYNIIETSALATVTVLTLSGSVEISEDDLDEDGDIIIEGGSTVTIPDGAQLPGDVIIGGEGGDVTVVGDLDTKGEVNIKEDGGLEVEGDLNAEGGLVIGENGSGTVGGNLTTGEGGDLTIGGGGNVTVEDGDVTIGGEVNVGNSGSLTVEDGDLTIDGGDLTIGEGGKVEIKDGNEDGEGGNLTTGEEGDVLIGENGTLIVDGDTQIGGDLTGGAGSEITLDGNVNIGGSVNTEGDFSQTDKDATVDIVGDLNVGGDVSISGKEVTVGSDTTIGGDAHFTNPDGEVVFEGDANFGGDVTFDGDVIFNGDVTFTENPTFSGDVIFGGGGTITAPAGGLVIDNTGKTITISGPTTIDGDLSLSGGTVVIGDLTITGDADLKDVTLDVSKDAVLNIGGDLTVADLPRSILNLTELEQGANDVLTLTGVDANPGSLFDITVGGQSASSQGVTYSWVENPDGSWTLKATAQNNITLTYYTLKIHSTTKEGLRVSPGLGSFPIEANAYMSLDLTLDAQHTGKSLSLIINGETIELTKSVAQTQYSHNLRFITRDLDIEIVLKEKTTTGNETIGAGEVKVYGLQGALRVETATLTDLTIYTIAGRPVASEKVNGTKEFYLPSGIYIVRTTISTPVKAVVR